jgi:AcrR family transcriptional regulator
MNKPKKKTRQNGHGQQKLRRRQLIDATLQCLAAFGHRGTTVRLVCARAGLSPGMVIQYFEGIDDLIAASYAHLGNYVAEAFGQAMDEAGEDPLSRLRAVVDANFRPPVLDKDNLSIWLAFWSLVRTNPRIRRTHATIYGKYRRRLGALIERLAESRGLDLDARQTVFGFTAMTEGLWLQLCLEPSRFSTKEASRFAHSWIDAMIDGRFARRS